jgi:hypothetical protein
MHALAISRQLQICLKRGERNATEGVPYRRRFMPGIFVPGESPRRVARAESPGQSRSA